MGWGEWPLFIFTVTAQTATGAFWWCCVALLAAGLPSEQASQLERSTIVIWGLVALSFCAAAFHLGSPLRAINASFRFGRSAFSNEVVFGSAFVGLGTFGWLMNVFGIGSPTLLSIVLGLTVLCSFAFLASMTAFYMMPTVPTWNTYVTPTAYMLTTILGGSILAATLFAAVEIRHSGLLIYGPAAMAVMSLVAIIALTLAQGALLPKINSSIKRAVELSPHYAGLMAVRFVILFSALLMWGLELSRAGMLSVETGIVALSLVVLGELVGRGVHYGLHMTVGLR